MTWAEVIDSPYLRDIPFKIELNEWGQIVMSPASNRHSNFQCKIYDLLKSQKTNGAVLTECSIETRKNIKVPDTVWMSSTFIATHNLNSELDGPLVVAPELCVEVISPSNSRGELKDKRELYFERGALEVWFCSLNGDVTFFEPTGQVQQSHLFPNFPNTISSTLE